MRWPLDLAKDTAFFALVLTGAAAPPHLDAVGPVVGLEGPEQEHHGRQHAEDEGVGEVSVQPELDHVAAQTQSPRGVDQAPEHVGKGLVKGQANLNDSISNGDFALPAVFTVLFIRDGNYC